MKKPGNRVTGAGLDHDEKPAPLSPRIDTAAALRFLELLGKDPATARLRFFPHKHNPRKKEIGARKLVGIDAQSIARQHQEGRGAYVCIGDSDGRGDKKENITAVPALFVEWDDRPIEWQRTAWQELGLPEPSIQVGTGGASVHTYWLLTQPLAPQEWEPLQKLLIELCNSDPNCADASRVMRLPGCAYIGPDGKPAGRTTIISASGKRYDPAEILPAEPAPAPSSRARREEAAPPASRDYPPRSLDEVREALHCIPQRKAGSNTYGDYRNILWGLVKACEEAGSDREMAVALMEEHSPSGASGWDVPQVARSGGEKINAETFWWHARQNGWRPTGEAGPDALDVVEVHDGQPGGALELKHKPKPRRLTAYDVRQLLPERLGRIRRNIRSGEVKTDNGTASGNETSRLYVHLCSDTETWPKEATADAVEVIASANPYDPVRDYLEAIATPPLAMEQWQRLDQHLLGIDHPIVAAFLPRYFISAVARTMDPGCEIRQTPVLIGPQWRGKSALGRILFGAEHWVEGVGNLDRDAIQRAHTAWGVELAELDGVTRRNDTEKLKAFLTERTDTIQLKYDRHPSEHQRRFVFWGTANAPPLTDSTGSTRFVCIRLPDRMLPLEWAHANRNALWARALEQYRAGVPWDRISEEERQAIEEMNSDFEELDPWSETVEAELVAAEAQGRIPVKIPDLLMLLGVEQERQNNATVKRVRAIAARLGWEVRRTRKDGIARRGLWPPEPPAAHTEHTACTPRYVRANASGGAGGGGAVHTVHTSSPEKEEKEEGAAAAPAQPPPAAAAENAGKSGRFGMHGMYALQTDCPAVDLAAHTGPAVHTGRGVHGAPLTGKPPTFEAHNVWGNAPPLRPRSDAERLYDRQARDRLQREVEALEQPEQPPPPAAA